QNSQWHYREADRRLRRNSRTTGDPMTMSVRAGVIAIAAVAVGLSLAGCGSDTKPQTSCKESTTSRKATSTSASAPSTPPQPAGQNYTIVDYIRDNGIVER